jgi:ABC-type transport system substrate-binding protein
MPRRRHARRRPALFTLAAAMLFALSSCGPGGSRGSLEWVAACAVPRFDPDGPPDDVRWSIERLLSEGLTRERADGRIEGAAADRFDVSQDGLSWTFHLRPNLRFTDGKRCTSADFKSALISGLARQDHGVRTALLGALHGMKPVRAGRPRPPLGIETPDERTLVLRLDRPDSLLPSKLALPGISAPWRSRLAGEWSGAVGLGPYRLAGPNPGARMVMARVSGAGPDSVRVRFVIGEARLRSLLRAAHVDLLWPLPPELLNQPMPTGYRLERSEARPRRRLLLVMRADTPPTSHEEARRALAHGINRADVLATLGRSASASGELVSGAGVFPAPRYDATQVTAWMAKGDLGRSFHVVLLYDADRAGAAVASAMQGVWSRQSIDVELKGLRGSDFASQALEGREQLLLAEWQPLERGREFEALALVQAPRVPPISAFRTGWRPAEWAALRAGGSGGKAAGAEALESALERDLVVVPLADLPWVRLVREDGPPAPFHPHFGPDFAAPAGSAAAASGTSGVSAGH